MENAVSPGSSETPPGALAGLRVHLTTFGCQMNKYDSGMVAGLLGRGGFTFVDDEQDADVVILNTCAVRGHAEERVYSRLGALKQRKRRQPGLVIAVLGCLAQKEGAHIAERFPHVNLLVGTRRLSDLPGLLERAREGAGPPLLALEEEPGVDFGPVLPRRESRACAYLTVVRGCDKRCTYCVVPYTRGKESSRPVADVVAEAQRLAADGVREITLLGQTIDTYGRDLPPDAATGRRPDLAQLLRALHPLPGLLRLRFLTSHPGECREDLWRAMSELGDKVMPFVHMPAQSGSDRVLRRMGRGYTRARYVEAVTEARRLCPEIEFASDWIVGFSGETEEDFAQSLALLEEAGFQSSYVFKYSVRGGTPAARLADDVPRAVKEERHRRLMAVQARVSLAKNQARIGAIETVLAEGPSKTDPRRVTGRSRTFRLVHFPGGAEDAGRLVRVRITSATALALVGERADDI